MENIHIINILSDIFVFAANPKGRGIRCVR